MSEHVRATAGLVVIFVVAMLAVFLGYSLVSAGRQEACENLGGTLTSNQQVCISPDGRLLDSY